jgi:hypothetical protein
MALLYPGPHWKKTGLFLYFPSARALKMATTFQILGSNFLSVRETYTDLENAQLCPFLQIPLSS